MKKLYFFPIILLVIGYSHAAIINVPADQPTIQAAIDAAVNGDTILVQPGIYVENINYNGKNISVASLFLITQDTAYISQTIINGGGYGTVRFTSGSDSTALLCGFTITNGKTWKGGGISCENSSPRLTSLKVTENTAWWGGGIALENSCSVIRDVLICNNSALNDHIGGSCQPDAGGGGIYCEYSNPVVINTTISRNWVSSLTGGFTLGGGIYCYASSVNLTNVRIIHNFVEPGMNEYSGLGTGGGIMGGMLYLSNVTITGNSANNGGGIASANIVFDSINRCNIYLNHANKGNDLFYTSCPINEIVVDTFTVFSPTEFFAYPIENFSFDILNGYVDIIPVESDLFVAPDGDNSNSGLTMDEPLKNIGIALAKIQADSLHPRTIFLLNGYYSQSTNGEIFPLYLTDYITLSGMSPDGVTMDAEGHSILAIVNSRNGVGISDLTIQGSLGGRCGGFFCRNANPDMENVKLLNNTNVLLGGVLYLENSAPVLSNCLITGHQGFGIFCNVSDPYLINVTISHSDTSYFTYGGGGICCKNGSHPVVVNSILWNELHPEISFYSWLSSPGAVTVLYSDIEGGEEGIEISFNHNDTVYWLEGNMDLNPLFAGTGEHAFALSDDSPCINTGTPDTTGLNLPLVDLAGNPRIFGERIEMGAYENQNIAIGITDHFPDEYPGFTCLPNPFTNELTITYDPKESADIKIEIYNSAGKKVKELSHKCQSEGRQVYQMKTNDLPAGVYYCVLKTNERIQTRKIIKL